MTTDLQTTPYTADQALREAAIYGTIGAPTRTWKSGAVLVPVTVPGRWHGNIRCTPQAIEDARRGTDPRLELSGDTWRVLSVGATRDGLTFVHLASATRGKWQRNGWCPVQACDWIPSATLAAAQEATR